MGGGIAPFDADLTRVRDEGRAAVSMNDDLLAAAGELTSFADGVPLDADERHGFPFVATAMEPHYTTAREREVHEGVVKRRLAA